MTRFAHMRRALHCSLPCSLAPFLTALLAAQAQTPAPPDAAELLEIAGRRLARQAPDEEALLLLWQAEDMLRDAPAGAARDASQKALHDLLPKADPLADARTQTFAATAKKMLELALVYRQKRMFELADERVRAVAQYDPVAAQKEQQTLAAVRGAAAKAPVKAPAAPAKTPPPAAEKPLLERMTANGSPGWQLQNGELTSPTPKGDAPDTWISTTAATDNEITCEIKLGQGNAGAEVIFGGKQLGDVFMAGVYQYEGGRKASVRAERILAGNWKALGEQRGPTQVGDGFHQLAIRVRGSHVALQLDGRLRLEVDVDRPAQGFLGFQVTAMHGNKQGAVFRNLAIGPLPDETKPTENAAQQEQQQQQQEQAKLQAAAAAQQHGEALLKEHKAEAAVVELLHAQALARELAPGPQRDQSEAALDRLLQGNDPQIGKRKAADAEIAALFAALADRYVAAGFARCGLVVAARARAFDPAGQAGLGARIAAAVAAHDASEAEAKKRELEPPPIDDTELRSLFARGRMLLRDGKPWKLDGAGARALGLTDGGLTVLLPPGKPMQGGRFAVVVHLPQPGAAGGFAFDALGDNDYALATVRRSAQQLVVSVRRFYLGRWQTLAERVVPCPAWQLPGWFELQLEDLADAVIVRTGDVELKLERSRLGAIGPIGLAGEAASPGPVDVEIRGLRQLQ
jgi:hypothetical protein